MLGVGQNIERYVVEDYVGHGGMAVVYRVRHVDLGTLHALKVLTVARPAVRERLLQEGRAQAGLRHPNVVGVTDVIRVDGSLALVMEYIDGPDLSKWLARYGKASLDECRVLVRGLCDGLGEAHVKGIVHRDLKPQNVLMERTPAGFRAKITDFGIAKILEEGGSSPRNTRSDATLGTPNYMAPEQVRDASSADHRADLFALGAIVYEAATGKLAFPGNDVLTVLNAVAAGRYERPSESHMDLDVSLMRVIEGCLEVDPARRFGSCADVLAVLGADVPEGARIQRGTDVTDWFDAESKRARGEWLATAPPSMARKLAAPDTTHGEIGEEVTEQISMAVRRDDDITPGVGVAGQPASGGATTVPRPAPRDHLPEIPEVTESVPTAVLVVRRVVISALIGTLLGLVGFLLLVRLTDWPRSMLAPAPEPTPVGLDEVVTPDPQPEPQP